MATKQRTTIDEVIAARAAEFHVEWPEGIYDTTLLVERGMTPEQVVMIQCEPDEVQYSGPMTLWDYNDHHVVFINGRVFAVFDRPAHDEDPADKFERTHSQHLMGHPCCRAFMAHMRKSVAE